VLFESVKSLGPMSPVRVQPGVHLGQWRSPQGIEAAPTGGAHTDQPRVFENPQLLRDGRLGDAEVVNEFTYRALALPEQIEDPAARRLCQGGESGHVTKYNRFGI
jgi:hypothetical protein